LIREDWRAVPNFERSYEVSDQGRIRSRARLVKCRGNETRKACIRKINMRVLRPGKSPSGHLSVVLGRAAGTYHVHALVLSAFIGPRPPKSEARHRNGNPADNRLVNLEWASRSRNTQDKKWHVLPKNYRLRPADVRAIRKQRAAGATLKTLAEKFGVSHATISSVCLRRTHGDVA